MLAVAARVLARTPYTLPAQDLGYDLSRIPTRPRSGVILEPSGQVR
jgi:fatty-acid peroxygenase